MTRRRKFTDREVLTTCLLQGAVIPCGCGCGKLIDFEDIPKVIKEHFIPLAMKGADEPHNCDFRLGPCADLKTNGRKNVTSYGSDRHAIDKAKRIRGETKTGPKKQIQNRGFEKLPEGYNPWTRKMRM